MTFSDRINAAARRAQTWQLYILCLLPVPWWFYQAQTGALGPNPVEALEHKLGLFALQLFIASLCITPLRRYVGVNLLRFRRALGLLSFIYVMLHLLVWAVLDVQTIERVWADIIKRPYITVGMSAAVLMIPLAITSNNWSLRRLGRLWQQLHKLTYAIALLVALHFLWVRKGFQLEPLIYFAIIAMLLALRWRSRRFWQQQIET